MMQPLQGSVDVRGALHCKVGNELLQALENGATLGRSDSAHDAGRPCSDIRPALFVPACIIKLGVIQVCVLAACQCPSHCYCACMPISRDSTAILITHKSFTPAALHGVEFPFLCWRTIGSQGNTFEIHSCCYCPEAVV